MFLDDFRVRRPVNAINFIVCHVAVEPLNLGAEIAEHRQGVLRRGLSLLLSHLSCPRDFPLNDELRHRTIISRALRCHPSRPQVALGIPWAWSRRIRITVVILERLLSGTPAGQPGFPCLSTRVQSTLAGPRFHRSQLSAFLQSWR